MRLGRIYYAVIMLNLSIWKIQILCRVYNVIKNKGRNGNMAPSIILLFKVRLVI